LCILLYPPSSFDPVMAESTRLPGFEAAKRWSVLGIRVAPIFTGQGEGERTSVDL